MPRSQPGKAAGSARLGSADQAATKASWTDLTKPDILELKDIIARSELKDGQHVTVTSINGVYDTKGELLRLNDHITVNTNSGYEARLSEATVNTTNGNIVSENPVEVKLPNGLLNANRLEVMENGASITLWRPRRDDAKSGPNTTRSSRLSTSRCSDASR